jgi:hypothetical protein
MSAKKTPRLRFVVLDSLVIEAEVDEYFCVLRDWCKSKRTSFQKKLLTANPLPPLLHHLLFCLLALRLLLMRREDLVYDSQAVAIVVDGVVQKHVVDQAVMLRIQCWVQVAVMFAYSWLD